MSRLMPSQPTVLLTRPEAAAQRFGAALRAAGSTTDQLIAPVLDIRPVPGALVAATPPPDAARGVILTSVHGVAGFVAQSPLRPPAWCVGHSTARAAREAGFDIRAAATDADELFRLMLGAADAGPFLHPRGRHTRGALAERLSAAGLPTGEVVIYEQIARPLSVQARALLEGTAPVILPLFSPRTARLVGQAALGAAAPLIVVAISDAAAAGWEAAQETEETQAARAPVAPQGTRALRIARRPDADAMVTETLAAIADVASA